MRSSSRDLQSGQMTATTTAQPLTSGKVPGEEFIVQNSQASGSDLLVGGAKGQYHEVPPGASVSLPVAYSNVIYVKTAAGTATVNWLSR